MTRDQAIKVLGRALVESGFEGRGRHFHLAWPELEWMVQLELIPRSERVGIYVGVNPVILESKARPTKANDCPIVFHLEGGGEPFGLERWEAWRALSFDISLTETERVSALYGLAQAVGGVAQRVRTLVQLRQMATDGHVRGFVRKDARALLF